MNVIPLPARMRALLIPALLGAAAPLSAALPAAPPSHVVLVIEENHGYDEIIGSSAAPYMNALAQGGALMTQSFAVAHPSEPNYLELFSGSTQGVTDDSCPHAFSAPNLGSQLLAAGNTFTGYSEDLPYPGYTGCGSAGYAYKHNPWVMFPAIPASSNQPFSAFPQGHFQDLPLVSIVVPNLNDDMHDGTIQAADSWLQANLDGYVQWARNNNSLLILTFDEDDNGPDNHIATFFVGPMVTPGQYSETINHDTVLRTLEDLYGLPHAGHAATAAAIADIWSGAAPATFTVTASAGQGGLISPSGSLTVARGGSLAFTITANAGYSIASVLVDGVDQGALGSYTFTNVTANHTIQASFTSSAPTTYTVTASAGPGGQISPSGSLTVPKGGSLAFTITASAGYSIASVLVDGVNQGALGGYTFTNVTGNHTIQASFSSSAPATYTVTASAGQGGQISPSGSLTVPKGGSLTFTITANAGYRIASVLVDGVNQGAPASYTFTNVTSNHAIQATFAPAAAGGKVISIDFVGSRTAPMAATEVAGVLPRAHWNAAPGAVGAAALPLVDESGAATGATVRWWASRVRHLRESEHPTGDMHLMRGYLDAEGANTIIRLAGLPPSATGYDVLVYADGNNEDATRSAIYQVSGAGLSTAHILLIDAANTDFTGTYRQASWSAGNYVRFTGIRATAFSITAIPSTASDGEPRAPVNGIQIVPTPTR